MSARTPSRARPHTRRLTLCALLLALACVLSFLDSLLPLPLPGAKLGLANLVTLFTLYHLSPKEALAIVLARCALIALLFGSPSQLAFSLSGGLLALGAALPLRRLPALSPIGVGMASAAAHNLAQVSVAAALLRTPGLYAYLVWLLPVALLTGASLGYLYFFVAKKLSAFPAR